MGIFGRGKGGGLMNVIRCDEENYLVWKWRPLGQDVNSTTRENSIRYGSSLRVKDGEVAVFLYKQKDGTMQDFIVGPYDDTIKTANFPVLSSIVGLAFGGESPFQAEVYYINIQGRNQIKFAVPYFDMFDPRFPEMMIPVSVHGTLTFALEDYKNFIKLNRLIDFSLDKFRDQIRASLTRFIKSRVSNAILSSNIPLVQAERYSDELSNMIEESVRDRLHEFGVEMKFFDISEIIIDKENENFVRLKSLTSDATAKVAQAQVDYNLDSMKMQGKINLETMKTQSDVNLQNLKDMQRINAENAEETMRIQREEGQYAQHLRSQQDNLGAYTAALQADVLKTGTENLGKMGTMNLGGGDAQMGGVPPMSATPPPIGGMQPPMVQYYISVNGMQHGPLSMQQMQSLVASGQMTTQTFVWKQGMPNWDAAANIPELAQLFMQAQAPGPPPMPPMP